MADAKKCDICGKYYDHYNLNRDPENPNALIFVNVDEEGFYGNDDDDVKDCCPTCMESIQNHIKILRGNADYEQHTVKVEEPKVNPHRCETCAFDEIDCEECRQCVKDNNDPKSIPSMWRSKGEQVHKVADDKYCITCIHFCNGPDSEFCRDCPTPEDAHSNWVCKTTSCCTHCIDCVHVDDECDRTECNSACKVRPGHCMKYKAINTTESVCQRCFYSEVINTDSRPCKLCRHFPLNVEDGIVRFTSYFESKPKE